MTAPVVRRGLFWLVATLIFAAIAAGVTSCQQGVEATDGKGYKVDRANVTVAVQPDASLVVTERLRFAYEGSFSGAYRDIPLQDGVVLSGLTLSDAKSGAYRPGGNTALGSDDEPGKVGTAGLPTTRGVRVVWHYRQRGGTRDFTLRYRIRGATIASADALVVPWAVWGDQWSFWLARLEARITVAEPASGLATPTEAYLQPGDLGTQPSRSSRGASVAFDRARPGEQIAMTAIFPRSVVRSAAGAATTDAAGIAKRRSEAKDAAKAGAFGAAANAAAGAQLPIVVVFVLLFGGGAMALYRAGRELDPGTPEHLPGPPAPLPPAVGYALANEGAFSDRVVLATLLDLVDRGYYRGEPTEGKELDLRLSVAEPRPELSALAPYEQLTLRFFDDLLADGGPAALGELKDRIPEHSESWRKRWSELSSALDGAGDDLIHWDRDLRGRRLLLGLGAIVAFGLLFLLVAHRTGLAAPTVAGLLSALVAIFLFPSDWLRRRDPESIKAGREWAAFAKWTNDFPRLQDDPPATLALWRRVLVYGVAFGTADRVVESGRIPAPVGESDDGWSRSLTTGSLYTGLHGSSFASGFSSQVAPVQSSSSSGSSGGGGGFSGGGGGGAW